MGESAVVPSGARAGLLDDFAEVVVGGTPSTKRPEFWGGDVVWVTPTDITGLNQTYLTGSARRVTDVGIANSSARVVPEGSVLVTTRATIGPAAIAGCNLATNQGVTALIPRDGVDNRWLYYWVAANEREFRSRGAGNTFPEISRSKTKHIPIVVPPLEEQRRVVEVMEAVDGVAEGYRRKLESASRVLLAIGGAEWAKSGRIKLGTLGQTLTGKTPSTKVPEYWENPDVAFLTPGDFGDGLLLAWASRKVSESGADAARLVPAGSVVQVCIGATLGKVGVTAVDYVPNQQVNALVGLDHRDAVFVGATLHALEGQRAVWARAGQTTLPILKKSEWVELEIPWPNADERFQTAGAVLALENVRQVAATALRGVERVRSAFLDRLMAGDLEVSV